MTPFTLAMGPGLPDIALISITPIIMANTQKIVSGKYPENYRHKRTSKIMPLMPHLSSEISNLYAFINSF